MVKKYTKILSYAEMLSLALTTIGYLLSKLNFNTATLITFGLVSLAFIFLLSAYIPIVKKDRAEKGKEVAVKSEGFAHLFAFTILPKVLYLSMAVSCMAILFSISAWEGATSMLQIGVNSLLLAILFLFFTSFTKEFELKHFIPVLMRAIPVALVAGYLHYF